MSRTVVNGGLIPFLIVFGQVTSTSLLAVLAMPPEASCFSRPPRRSVLAPVVLLIAVLYSCRLPHPAALTAMVPVPCPSLVAQALTHPRLPLACPSFGTPYRSFTIYHAQTAACSGLASLNHVMILTFLSRMLQSGALAFHFHVQLRGLAAC